MRRAQLTLVLILAVLLAACSSSGEVRSDDGPQAESTVTSALFDPDGSGGQDASTTTAAVAASPSTSPMIATVGTVTVPDGESGELSVVLQGLAIDDSGSLPVVVRNRTSDTVFNVEATATARGADGSLAGSGSSQGFAPTTVAPGEWAFGYVYFGGSVPAGAEFDITATAETESGFIGSVDVKPVETNIVPSEFSGQQIVGIVENGTEQEVSGPVSVQVMCFDQAGSALVKTHSGFTDADSIAAGGTASFSVDLFEDPCPNFAVGASGYDF